ncbi:MAG: hypothetical protein USCGTAYLOR_03028 [Chromatiales bacterium USCg_Taylor]|nr:MAG: hypothetical protein USCGTAYLOR_03028 [Chromatiales bacterium USCg_Taylor]
MQRLLHEAWLYDRGLARLELLAKAGYGFRFRCDSGGLIEPGLSRLQMVFVYGGACEVEELLDGPLLFVGAFRHAPLVIFLGS